MVPVFLIGLASALLTELLKLVPILDSSDGKRRLTAFIVAFLVSCGWVATQPDSDYTDVPGLIMLAAPLSFLLYKSLIQPVQEMWSESKNIVAIVAAKIRRT